MARRLVQPPPPPHITAHALPARLRAASQDRRAGGMTTTPRVSGEPGHAPFLASRIGGETRKTDPDYRAPPAIADPCSPACATADSYKGLPGASAGVKVMGESSHVRAPDRDLRRPVSKGAICTD